MTTTRKVMLRAEIIPVETRALEYFIEHYLDNTAQSVFEILDSPTEEIGETVGRIVRRNVTSTVLKTCKREELNEDILENLYSIFVDKVMDTVQILRKKALRERREILEEFRKNNKKTKTKKVGVCVACNSPALLKCGKCRRACYCGVECQRSDWLHHKEICEGCN